MQICFETLICQAASVRGLEFPARMKSKTQSTLATAKSKKPVECCQLKLPCILSSFDNYLLSCPAANLGHDVHRGFEWGFRSLLSRPSFSYSTFSSQRPFLVQLEALMYGLQTSWGSHDSINCHTNDYIQHLYHPLNTPLSDGVFS